MKIEQSIDKIYKEDTQEREDAFKRLEDVRRKNDMLDYDAELARYREEKYD